MQALNLPSYDYKLKTLEGKNYIFDEVRKKFVILTPEEWVRQHFLNVLIVHLNYPKGRISVEKGLKYKAVMQKRTDILVYDKDGKVEMLIELKAPSVQLNQDTFNQLAIYNNNLNAKYLVISNGVDTFCFTIEEKKLIQLDSLPRIK